MLLWQIFLLLAMIFILIEIFVPTMFFINFAIACLFTSALSVHYHNLTFLVVVAVVLSGCFLTVLRPMLMSNLKLKTGVEDKYIGKVVKVIEPINSSGGAITIYGERWNAKSDEEIPIGADVKIIKNDSLVFYVEKI